jgi:hypothetical protein
MITKYDFDIVVPVISYHVKYLKDLLINISNFTIKPRKLILIVSNQKNFIDININNFLPSTRIITKIFKKKIQQGIAKNLGATFATSKWIFFFDADDLYSTTLAKVGIDTCNKFSLDALIFSLKVISKKRDFEKHKNLNHQKSPNYNFKSEIFHKESLIKFNINNEHGPLIIKSNKKMGVNHGSIIIKRKVFNNLKFVKTFYDEDTKLVRKILKSKYSISFLNEKMLFYRNMLSARNEVLKSITFLEKVSSFIKNKFFFNIK